MLTPQDIKVIRMIIREELVSSRNGGNIAVAATVTADPTARYAAPVQTMHATYSPGNGLQFFNEEEYHKHLSRMTEETVKPEEKPQCISYEEFLKAGDFSGHSEIPHRIYDRLRRNGYAIVKV
jgi:hypothetical protein